MTALMVEVVVATICGAALAALRMVLRHRETALLRDDAQLREDMRATQTRVSSLESEVRDMQYRLPPRR